MQNSPTNNPAPPPLLLPPPPHSTDQITVFPIPPPPPPPFAASPSSVFQITVLPAPPSPPLLPPFAGEHSSVDLSPLEFLLALIAIVTIPALIYTFIFAYRCPSSRRRRPSAGELSGDQSVMSEQPHHDHDVENSSIDDVTDVKYQKDTHVKEIGGECPVCLSAFADGEEIRQLSVCKHSFHSSCIDMWLSNHSNCPICRADIAAVKSSSSNSSAAAPNRDGDLQQGHHRDASALV